LVDKLAGLPEYQLPALLKLLEWRTNGEDSSNGRLTAYIERELLPRTLVVPEVAERPAAQAGQAKARATVTFSQTEWVSKFGQSVGRVLRVVDEATLDEQRLAEVGVVLANDQESLQAMVALRDRLNRLLAQVERG
jgi:hypothetical protein